MVLGHKTTLYCARLLLILENKGNKIDSRNTCYSSARSAGHHEAWNTACQLQFTV